MPSGNQLGSTNDLIVVTDGSAERGNAGLISTPSFLLAPIESWFSPYINHFISADTVVASFANPQSLNRYAYVSNNPIRNTDPTGHKCVGDPRECLSEDGNTGSGFTNGGSPTHHFVKTKPASCGANLPKNCDGTPKETVSEASGTTTTTTNSQSSPLDEMIQIIKGGVDSMHLLDLIEDGIQYGRPAYRQVKYAISLSGAEYTIDGLLQLHDDRNKDLTFDQRVMRGAVRAGESAFTDGVSMLVGGSAGAATGGAGFIVGSYTSSVIVDRFFVNNANPYIFNKFLGGP